MNKQQIINLLSKKVPQLKFFIDDYLDYKGQELLQMYPQDIIQDFIDCVLQDKLI